MHDVPRIWIDGHRVDATAPALRALDHGVTVGDGAFEACKVVEGRAFARTRHARRLARSMAGLGLPAPDLARIDEGIESVLSGPPIAFGRLRYVVTAGAGPLGSDRDVSAMTYLVAAVAHPRPPAHGKVVVVPWTRNERGATAGLKTTSYADNVVALAHAKKQGGLEAVFANTRGELCEGTGSNVFVVVAGEVLTPPLTSGCLAGVTRELVIAWARAAGLIVHERALPVGVLQSADEVFLTSSLKDVFPVSAVDERVLPVPGPVTARVAALFAQYAAAQPDP